MSKLEDIVPDPYVPYSKYCLASMNNSFKKIREAEEEDYKKIKNILEDLPKDSIFALKATLLIEKYIDDLIVVSFKRGDRILQSRFYLLDKVMVLHSAEILPEKIVTSIKQINNLRNKFAHELNYSITERDVDLIGLPLGKRYLTMKKIFPDSSIRFNRLIYYIVGYLSGLKEGFSSN